MSIIIIVTIINIHTHILCVQYVQMLIIIITTTMI